MRLASRGLRDLDGGVERIDDAEERRILRMQAFRVLGRSVLATAVAMAVVVLLP
jgi:hypothetical protein